MAVWLARRNRSGAIATGTILGAVYVVTGVGLGVTWPVVVVLAASVGNDRHAVLLLCVYSVIQTIALMPVRFVVGSELRAKYVGEARPREPIDGCPLRRRVEETDSQAKISPARVSHRSFLAWPGATIKSAHLFVRPLGAPGRLARGFFARAARYSRIAALVVGRSRKLVS